ncbi:hypothetical protein HYV57_04540, partial [Candidatus Peregrinibacteria bacterium]|nr:hypothetical protein [Candidatus Peregrinibacteria bacterium]
SGDALDIFGYASIPFKNSCQINDLYSIDTIVSNAKNALMTAYSTCDDTKISAAKDRYYELKFEEAYLRQFVECTDKGQCFFAAGDSLELTDKNVLRENLSEEFVTKKQWFSPATFEKIFTATESKYNNRFKIYTECQNDQRKQLGSKFKELWNNLKSIFSQNPLTTLKSFAGNEIQRQEEKRRKRHEQGVASFSDIGEFGTNLWQSPLDTMGSAVTKRIGVKVNGIEPVKGLQEIAAGLGTLLPENELTPDAKKFLHIQNKAPTFKDVQQGLSEDEQRFSEEFEEIEMLEEYKALYGEGRNEMTTSLVEKLDDVREILSTSLDPLQKISECKARVAERQCVNK